MNNQIPFFYPYNVPNQMVNNNYERLEEKIERLEKRNHLLENRLNKLENQIKSINTDYDNIEPTDMYML